jgi:hypothetical protein
VRFENERIPSFKPRFQENAIEFGFGDKIAPGSARRTMCS